MAIPRKPNPIAQRKSRSQIEEAVKVASGMQTPGVSREEGSPRRAASADNDFIERRLEATPLPPLSADPTGTRRPGRPALKEGRTERVTAWMTPKTRRRLKLALFGEQAKRHGTTGDVDQSLIIEEAIEKWLDENNY
jgi:hypothetical protein